MSLAVKLYKPLWGTATHELLSAHQFDDEAVSASWSSVTAGGFNDCDVTAPAWLSGMPLPLGQDGTWLENRADIMPFAHIELSLDGVRVWEGMLRTLNPAVVNRGLALVGFGGQGYGVSLDHLPFDAHKYGAWPANGLQVLKWFITDGEPFLALGPASQLVDPEFTIERDQIDGLYFSDLVKQINSNGASHGFPVRCQVWEKQRAVIIARIPPIAPQIPDWIIPADEHLTLDKVDAGNLVGNVYTWAMGGGGLLAGEYTADDPSFKDRFGVRRNRRVKLGDRSRTDLCTAFAKGMLTANRHLRISGSWETSEDMVAVPSGGELPAASMRAGQWAEIEGLGLRELTQVTMTYPERRVTVQFDLLSPKESWFANQKDFNGFAYRALNPNSWSVS